MLWQYSFVRILIINILTSMAMYSLLLIDQWILGRYFQENLSVAGAVVSVFGMGIFFYGPVANYWLDCYSRKSVVLWALFFMLLFTVITLYRLPEWMYIVARFMQGSSYGLFQIALGSTLLIDLTNTKKRTEAAHWYYWFSRFALALGPLSALAFVKIFSWNHSIWLPAGMIFIAWLIMLRLHVPFRAPLEPRRFSCDRFLMLRAKILFFTLMPLSFLFGLFIPRNYTMTFYVLMFVGFVLAQAVHYIFFRKRDSRLLMLLGYASVTLVFVLQLLPYSSVLSANWMTPCLGVLLGAGGGMLTSRYLIYFMRVAEHCERGTAQSSYMLGWESGLCLGFLCSSLLIPLEEKMIFLIGLGIVLLLSVYYFTKVHKWFLTNSRKGM